MLKGHFAGEIKGISIGLQSSIECLFLFWGYPKFHPNRTNPFHAYSPPFSRYIT